MKLRVCTQHVTVGYKQGCASGAQQKQSLWGLGFNLTLTRMRRQKSKDG